MHVVSLSLDPHVLDPNSVVAQRSRGYGEVLDSYTVIVPTAKSQTVQLSSHVTVLGTGGKTKLGQLWCMYQLAKKTIKQNRCDVITSQDTYFLALIGYLLARRYHLGLEVQVHGLEKLNWFRRRLMRFAVHNASSVRVVSKRLKRFLRDELGVTHERVVVIPIYVDTTSLNLNVTANAHIKKTSDVAVTDFRKKYGDRLNVVTVSRLVPVKNIELQLQTAQLLRSSFPNLCWHIVGDGPLRKKLVEQVTDLQLEHHVIFHGYKTGEALIPFFSQTDCFVLTSFSEGWGMAVIEAAAAGLPIVMTDVGCAGEVIKDDESGVILQKHTPAALAEVLRTVLGDPELRSRLGNAAKANVAALPNFATIQSLYIGSWETASRNRL